MKMFSNNVASDGFKRQYDLVVTVEQGRELNTDKTFKQTQAVIKSKSGKEYIIDEYLKGNLTDYCIVTIGKEEQRFDKYITAEKYVAEEIRREK